MEELESPGPPFLKKRKTASTASVRRAIRTGKPWSSILERWRNWKALDLHSSTMV